MPEDDQVVGREVFPLGINFLQRLSEDLAQNCVLNSGAFPGCAPIASTSLSASLAA